MGKIEKRAAGLVFAVMSALLFFGSLSDWRVSAQDQLHAPPPGGHKSSLKTRFLWHVKPLHIIGNVYFVGMSGDDFDAFLITSPQGDFLIDAGVPEEVRANIEELGFKTSDVKYLLEEHAHNDHVLGLAQMKQWTGGKLLAMAGDVSPLEDGGIHENFLPNMEGPVFPPVKVDDLLHDGQKIELGGVTVVAYLTPGHTPGCTTFTTEAEDHGKKYNVVIYGACNPMNQPLIGNRDHPNIVQDWVIQFKNLHRIHGDVLLGTTSYDEMSEKVEQTEKNPGTNAFVDPKAYDDFVAKTETTFFNQLKREIDTGAQFPINIPEGKTCPQDGRACYNVYDLVMKCCSSIGARYVGKD